MRLCFDIETNGLLESLSKIHIIVAQDVDTGDVYDYKPDEIEQGVELLSKADVLIAHNGIKFDIPALQKVYPDWTYTGEILDTLVMSRLIWTDLSDRDQLQTAKGNVIPGKLQGSHSLAAWGHRLKEHKGDYEGGWAEWNEEMHSYAKQDVVVTTRLWKLIESKEYSQKAIDLELQVATIMARCERHGFSFDEDAALSLVVELNKLRANLEIELQDTFRPWYTSIGEIVPKRTINYKDKPGVTEGAEYTKVKLNTFNPGSRIHIADRLSHLYGWKPDEFTPKGLPKIDETTLSKLTYPEAQLLNKYMTIQKRLGQLVEGKQGWLNVVREGRIHGTYLTNGAVTGRAIHQSPNIAQVPSCGAPWGSECRTLFRATPGNVLVGVDLAALELRCLSHFMARFDSGAYGEELLKGDIHTANQKAAGLSSRNQAKTFIYAFLYGAGAAKIGSIVGGGPAQGQQLKSRFLKQTPALATLIDKVSKAAESGFLKGLDGRNVFVRSQHAALNTLLQSAGALISKRWLVEIENGLIEADLMDTVSLVAWVHDEVQLEVTINDSHKSGHCGCALPSEGRACCVGRLVRDAARRAGEFFNFRIPIDAEATIGNSWADTH